jgi:hypothetical protein
MHAVRAVSAVRITAVGGTNSPPIDGGFIARELFRILGFPPECMAGADGRWPAASWIEVQELDRRALDERAGRLLGYQQSVYRL